jgi:hypothetical protein
MYRISIFTNAPASRERNAQASHPEHLFIRPTSRTTTRQLAVNHHSGNAANAKLSGSFHYCVLPHIMHRHVARGTGNALHQRNRLFTARTPGAEDFDPSFLVCHSLNDLLKTFLENLAGTGSTTRRGHAFQTAAVTRTPIPVYITGFESK